MSRDLSRAYRPVREGLAGVEELLRRPEALEGLSAFLGVSGDSRALDDAEQYILEAGGKRLRAALVLLCTSLCGAPVKRGLHLAAGIELFHTASLVIDDLIVDAQMRRSMPTIHRQWDDPGAMSAALSLQLRAVPSFLESFREAGDSLALMALVGQALTRMLWGAILQHRGKMNFELSEGEYMEIVEHKTAALFEACCEGGAIIAGKDMRVRKALRRYGHHLGRAFQLADDILDLEGDVERLGKSPGGDIDEGRLTLPMIHFLGSAPKGRKNKMRTMLPPRRPAPLPQEEILGMLREEGSISYTRKLANKESAKARRALQVFAECPERESLKILASLVVNREG